MPERDEPSLSPQKASRYRQLLTILNKNMLLQTRSSRSLFGLRSGGVATVLLEWLIPVLFILAMYPLKRFLADIPYPPVIFKEIPLQLSDWGNPYGGAMSLALGLMSRHPAVSKILFAWISIMF